MLCLSMALTAVPRCGTHQLQSNRPSHAPGRRALYMLPATPEADELQQLPLELPRYLLVALRESGGHRAYALLPPYAPLLQRSPCLMA